MAQTLYKSFGKTYQWEFLLHSDIDTDPDWSLWDHTVSLSYKEAIKKQNCNSNANVLGEIAPKKYTILRGAHYNRPSPAGITFKNLFVEMDFPT